MPTERPRRRRPSAQAPLQAKQASPEPDIDERWWVIVVSSAPELGSGRYGVWEEKPVVKITEDGNTAIVNGKNGHNDEEATIYINLRDTLTISVGKIEHFDAKPIGQADAANVPQS